MKNDNRSISFLGIIVAFLYVIPIIIVFISGMFFLDFFSSKYVSETGMSNYYHVDRNCGSVRSSYVCDSDIDKFNIQENEKTILKLRKWDNYFLIPLVGLAVYILIYLNIGVKKIFLIFKKNKN